MDNNQITPWYKQFWPWFLIAIPLSSVIVGTIVFRFATDGTNSMVVDDYYKEGKTINLRLDKIEQAKALNIKTRLSITNDAASLEFVSGQPASGEALKLDLFHATQPERDTELLLTRDANGVYRSSVDFPINGKWRLRLMPMDESWKIQKRLNLPQRSAIEFNPS